MEGLSLIEEQGAYLELTENDHAFLADLLQKAEEAGEDGVVGVSKTVAEQPRRPVDDEFVAGLSIGRRRAAATASPNYGTARRRN